ncbi:hypothetical protein BGW39_002403 [Mortierella sp. 14UC]|nr:hypothetical protein BGW39_002403 [Mortierella sp. 14UC]
MTNASVTFFSLPELTSELCLYLTATDIWNLMLTNRHMHNICRPLFWDTLLLRKYGVASRFTNPVANKEGLASFGRNIDAIRTLQTKGRFMSFYTVGLCKYLDDQNNSNSDSAVSTLDSKHQQQKQAIRRPGWYWERAQGRSILKDTALSLQACWVMSLNLNLTDVFLHGVDLNNERVVRCLARTISSLRHLKDLAIRPGHNTYAYLDVVDIIFRSCPQSLVSFKMSTDTSKRGKEEAPIDLNDNDIDAGPVVLRTEPLANLRVLQLPDNNRGYSAEEICPFLEHCPRLETWHLPCISESAEAEAITKVIRTNCKEIRRLLGGNPYGNYQGAFVKDVIEAVECQQLETLKCFSVQEEWPGQMMSLIEGHSQVLQKIKLRGCERMGSLTIHTILTSCPELRYLDISGHYSNRIAMSLEDAGSAKKWVCKKLRHLAICVTVPPTSTSLEQQPWDLLERFYRHLGSLHELEFLDLKGAGCRTYTGEDGQDVEREAEYNRLSFPGLFSLGDSSTGEPGYLSLLKDLKRLTTFQGSLSWHNAREGEPRGQKEMEWVVEHWPLLKMFEIIEHFNLRYAEYSYPYVRWLCEQMPQLKFCKPTVIYSCGHGKLKYSW